MKQNTFNKTKYFLADVPSVVYCTSCIVNNILKAASADDVNVFLINKQHKWKMQLKTRYVWRPIITVFIPPL